MKEKIGSIVWTVDPDNNIRVLLRHNRPFKGYEDEWTIVFGNVESNENAKQTAIREVAEEFGIINITDCQDLNYSIKFNADSIETVIKFFAIKVQDIDITINLSSESIGYDWMKLEEALNKMQHDDEKQAIQLVQNLIDKEYQPK